MQYKSAPFPVQLVLPPSIPCVFLFVLLPLPLQKLLKARFFNRPSQPLPLLRSTQQKHARGRNGQGARRGFLSTRTTSPRRSWDVRTPSCAPAASPTARGTPPTRTTSCSTSQPTRTRRCGRESVFLLVVCRFYISSSIYLCNCFFGSQEEKGRRYKYYIGSSCPFVG